VRDCEGAGIILASIVLGHRYS